MCIERCKKKKHNLVLYEIAGESREYALKLCIFSHFCKNIVPPSQSLNLKALTRTLDETEVSLFQGAEGGETLDILHGIEEHALKSLHFD